MNSLQHNEPCNDGQAQASKSPTVWKVYLEGLVALCLLDVVRSVCAFDLQKDRHDLPRLDTAIICSKVGIMLMYTYEGINGHAQSSLQGACQPPTAPPLSSSSDDDNLNSNDNDSDSMHSKFSEGSSRDLMETPITISSFGDDSVFLGDSSAEQDLIRISGEMAGDTFAEPQHDTPRDSHQQSMGQGARDGAMSGLIIEKDSTPSCQSPAAERPSPKASEHDTQRAAQTCLPQRSSADATRTEQESTARALQAFRLGTVPTAPNHVNLANGQDEHRSRLRPLKLGKMSESDCRTWESSVYKRPNPKHAHSRTMTPTFLSQNHPRQARSLDEQPKSTILNGQVGAQRGHQRASHTFDAGKGTLDVLEQLLKHEAAFEVTSPIVNKQSRI